MQKLLILPRKPQRLHSGELEKLAGTEHSPRAPQRFLELSRVFLPSAPFPLHTHKQTNTPRRLNRFEPIYATEKARVYHADIIVNIFPVVNERHDARLRLPKSGHYHYHYYHYRDFLRLRRQRPPRRFVRSFIIILYVQTEPCAGRRSIRLFSRLLTDSKTKTTFHVKSSDRVVNNNDGTDGDLRAGVNGLCVVRTLTETVVAVFAWNGTHIPVWCTA